MSRTSDRQLAVLAACDAANVKTYAARVRKYERQGMTTSDAQGVCDAEDMNCMAWRPLKQQSA